MKYVGPVVVYKIVDAHNYSLMTLDGIILKGIFEHERLKPPSLGQVMEMFKVWLNLRQVMNTEVKLNQYPSYSVLSMIK